MNIGMVRGVLTLVLLLAFVGSVGVGLERAAQARATSRTIFDQMAKLPLDEDA